MTVLTALLELIEDQGIHLRVENGELRFRAPSGVLNDDFRLELREHKEEILTYIEKNRPVYPKCVKERRQSLDAEELLLIPIVNQNRIWRGARPGSPPSSDYNKCHYVFRASMPEASERRMLDAIAKVVHLNDALLARIEESDGNPVLNLENKFPFQISTFEEPLEAEAIALATELVWAPFDLSNEPLFRCFKIHISNGEAIIGLVIHHLISDPRTMQAFWREMLQFCEVPSPHEQNALQTKRVRYTDYLVSLHRWLRSPEAYKEYMYWKKQLKDAPMQTKLSHEETIAKDDIEIESIPFTLNLEETHQLRKVSALLKITPFVILMAAHAVALSYVSDRKDIVLNMPYAARADTGSEDIVGSLTNHYYFRIQLSDTMRFSDLIKTVQRVFLEALSNGQMPFEIVVEKIVGHYLCVPSFNFFPFISPNSSAHERSLLLGQQIAIRPPHSENFWPPEMAYSIVLMEQEQSMIGSIRYLKNLYESETPILFLDKFRGLLCSIDEIMDRSITSCYELMKAKY